MAHRAPHRIVDNDEQRRQPVHRRGVVHRHRVGEQIGAVAQHRDDLAIGLGELDPERRAGTPAEPAGRARPEIAARPGRRAVLGQQRVFVDEHRFGVARGG